MCIADKLRSEYSECICTGCNDKGCQIKLDRLSPNHVVIGGSKYQEKFHYSEKLCDFIVFDFEEDSPAKVAVLEHRGGTVDEDDIDRAHEQLTNGASIAEGIIGSVEVSQFIPRIAKGKTLSPFASRRLAKDQYKVKFRRSYEPIKVIRCSTSLTFPL